MKKARNNCCRQHYDTATYDKILTTGKQKLLHIDVELDTGKKWITVIADWHILAQALLQHR